MAKDWMEQMFGEQKPESGDDGEAVEAGEGSRPAWMDWAERMDEVHRRSLSESGAELAGDASGAGDGNVSGGKSGAGAAPAAADDGSPAGSTEPAAGSTSTAPPPPPGATGSGERTTAPAAGAGNGGGAPPTRAPAAVDSAPKTSPSLESRSLDDELEELRQQAVQAAREDADAGLPSSDAEGPSESEAQLREWSRALFERWQNRQRRGLDQTVADLEEFIAEKLSRVGLSLDRFERLSNEIVRLKAKLATRRWEVSEELNGSRDGEGTSTGFGTRMYLSAISFLGLVEFFANAPVFSALLPRDPLTERQIRILTETSDGWLAGVQRVVAHIALRPDAALLAAGVVTFLCVLAHFFGHSLRDVVRKRDRKVRREAVASSSPLENVIPMFLTGVGLSLVLGVLYVSRVELGEVGQRQYDQDMARVEELRREAGWLRSDGDLLLANQKTNQADDLAGAAEDMKEYALSMSRMSFPILLLNATLVLCAITAAYFHRGDGRRERFDETPFEEDRADLLARGDQVAENISTMLAQAARAIRGLQARLRENPLEEWRSVAHQLEAAVSLYRAENGRARGEDPRTIPAFQEPVELELEAALEPVEPVATREPEDYERQRRRLEERFEEARKRFNEVAMSD